MKEKIHFVLLLGLPLLMVSSLFAKDPPILTLHGAIMDSQCAYNVHSLARSHNWMIRKGIAGAKDDVTCTQHCVKEKGGVYVLLVKQEVYRLDDQLQPDIYAGKKVKVTGTLDEKTHTLHVMTMEEDKPEVVKSPSMSAPIQHQERAAPAKFITIR